MAFVLYNISDEIVTREEAGFAYQEGNNRVGILFQENGAATSPKRQEKSVGKFRRRQKKLWDLTYLWESVNG